jgi:D-alanyl-D-alanine carboxypeptidase
MKNRMIWELSRNATVEVTSFEGSIHAATNTNELASSIPHFIGSKTGTTESAGESIVLLFEFPLGRPLLLVLLGSPIGNRTSDISEFFSKNNIL